MVDNRTKQMTYLLDQIVMSTLNMLQFCTIMRGWVYFFPADFIDLHVEQWSVHFNELLERPPQY